MSRIFLKLCALCEPLPFDINFRMDRDSHKMCEDCRAKIMQCVRILVSSEQAPAAVCVKLPNIPDEKEIGRWSRIDLLELIAKLR